MRKGRRGQRLNSIDKEAGNYKGDGEAKEEGAKGS